MKELSERLELRDSKHGGKNKLISSSNPRRKSRENLCINFEFLKVLLSTDNQ